TGVSLGTPTGLSDNCTLVANLTVGNDAPAHFPKGLTIVTWTVSDEAGNSTTCTQNVTVTDHEAPTIVCPAALTGVHTDAGQCYATGVNLGTPTGLSDNCTLVANLTVGNDAPAQFPKGLTIVT